MKQPVSILVVDDDANLRKTLGDILRINGYQPVLAASGADAIAALAQATVSLVLVDLRLPDMGGLEVMARIKAISPLTEVIILTGHASLETAIIATSQGAFSYLLKPYQVEKLLLTIKQGIERRQAQEEILRLASYPRLNPNPVIELASNGEVTYINPAAEQAFPDLGSTGQLHPILQGVTQISAMLRQSSQQESVREIRLHDVVYEQHISFVRESDLIHIYMLDITLRKRAEESLAIREREQAAVAELGSFALSGSGLGAVFERAVALVAQTLKVGLCLILEAQAGSEELLVQAGTGWDTAANGPLQNNADLALLTRLTQQSETPLYWVESPNDSHLSSRTLLKQLGVVSGVSLSIGTRSNFFGILGVFAAYPREFSKDDMNFLQALVNVLSAAVQRKRSEEKIHLLATTDSLTGIPNRREFSMLLEKEIGRAKRYGTALSLAMYDVDHFKRANDTFGHDAGDHVLQALTAMVKANIRAADVVARWGGDEFMILMPESDGITAGEAAGRLRQLIAQYCFDQVGNLTVSFGVAAFVPHDDLNSLLKRVDDALYQAKENGRDCVEILIGPAAP